MSKLTNAREELVKGLTKCNIPLRDIQAAKICQEEPLWETAMEYTLDENYKGYLMLYPGYTDSEFDKWLSKINEINYHSGYGSQQLFGTIWLRNGLWMTRGEYDGSEWWELRKRPPLPKKDKS